MLLLYCCFTAALPLFYRCFTGASTQRPLTRRGATGGSAHTIEEEEEEKVVVVVVVEEEEEEDAAAEREWGLRERAAVRVVRGELGVGLAIAKT